MSTKPHSNWVAAAIVSGADDKPAIRIAASESVAVKKSAKSEKHRLDAEKRRALEDMNPIEREAQKDKARLEKLNGPEEQPKRPECPGFDKGRCGTFKSRQDEFCKDCLRDYRRFMSRCPNWEDCKGYRYYDKELCDYVALCPECYRDSKRSEAPQCEYFFDCSNYVTWDYLGKCYFERCKPCQDIIDKRCPSWEHCKNHRRRVPNWDGKGPKYYDYCRECSQASWRQPKKMSKSDMVDASTRD